MSEVSVIGNAVVGNVRADAPATPVKPVEVVAPAERAEPTDSVEFSEKALLLEKIQQMPSVRQERIDAIKSAIESNTYLTADKLDIAIHRMIDDIRE